MPRTKAFSRVCLAFRQALEARKQGYGEHEIREKIHGQIESRREFLKVSAGLALSPLLSNVPLALRSPELLPESKRDPVLILGAGAAGLAAGYTLKKAGVPFLILEASQRVGGRIYTQYDFNSNKQFIECGGELVDTKHTAIRSLCNEVGLELEDLRANDKSLEEELLFFGDKVRSHADLVSALPPFIVSLEEAKTRGAKVANYKDRTDEKAVKWDQLSIAEFLHSLNGKVEPWVIDAIGVAYLGEFGRDLDDQSFLNLFGQFDLVLNDGFNMFGDSDESKRIKGGNSQLPTKIYERLSKNADPVVFGSKVISMRHSGNKLTVAAEQNGNVVKHTASQVICALPFSVLKDVEGLETLELNPLKLDCIQNLGYGQNTKIMLDFDSRPWRTKSEVPASTGLLYGDFISQSFWETSRSQKGDHGILTNFLGGKAGVQARNEFILEHAIPDLERVHKGIRKHFNRGVVLNWNQSPLAKGSYSCMRPGFFTRFGGAAGESELKGRLLFAGEHTSLEFSGFMNGAYESGITAAKAILISRNLERKPAGQTQ